MRRPPDPRGARPWPVGRRAGAHQARAVRVHAGDHNGDMPDACPGPRRPHRRTRGAGARAGSPQPVADRGRCTPVLPLATAEPHARGPIPADHREVPVAAATADHIRPARPRGRADGRARDRRDQCTDRPAAALPGPVCIKSVLAGGRHGIGINTLQTVGVGALLGTPTSSEGLARLRAACRPPGGRGIDHDLPGPVVGCPAQPTAWNRRAADLRQRALTHRDVRPRRVRPGGGVLRV